MNHSGPLSQLEFWRVKCILSADSSDAEETSILCAELLVVLRMKQGTWTTIFLTSWRLHSRRTRQTTNTSHWFRFQLLSEINQVGVGVIITWIVMITKQRQNKFLFPASKFLSGFVIFKGTFHVYLFRSFSAFFLTLFSSYIFQHTQMLTDFHQCFAIWRIMFWGFIEILYFFSVVTDEILKYKEEKLLAQSNINTSLFPVSLALDMYGLALCPHLNLTLNYNNPHVSWERSGGK